MDRIGPPFTRGGRGVGPFFVGPRRCAAHERVRQAFAYARIIVAMFFSEPSRQTPRATASPALGAAVAVAAAVTVLVGIAPQPLLDLVNQAGQFLR
jgi:hypothetical protein